MLLTALLLAGLALAGCRADNTALARPNDLSPLFQLLPAYAPAPADNPMTEASIDLGHKLFFEPQLSRSGTISCTRRRSRR